MSGLIRRAALSAERNYTRTLVTPPETLQCKVVRFNNVSLYCIPAYNRNLGKRIDFH